MGSKEPPSLKLSELQNMTLDERERTLRAFAARRNDKTLTSVGDWLTSIGRTPAQLRALADAMEKQGKGE